MLTVRKHNELFTKQYLIACYISTRPNHRTVISNPSPHRIILDFPTYKSDIIHLIPTIVDLRFVREAQKSLLQTVMTTRNELTHNRVLNWHPAPISRNATVKGYQNHSDPAKIMMIEHIELL